MTNRVKNRHLIQGFTLLELLVALSIFSILSVMAYGGLQTVISTKQSTQKSADRLAEVQLLMMRMSNDLRQTVSRKIRDEYGDFNYAMQTHQQDLGLVSWTRAGYKNPAHIKRSNVQRVAYQLEKQKLIRLTWPVLDRAQDTKALKTEVLSNVESIKWRFLNNKSEWVISWPEQENAELYPLPKAVEFTVELKDWGKIRRLILLAGNI